MQANRPSCAPAATESVGAVDQVDDDLEDVVDAVLAASRALVAISARSIAAAHDVTLPQYRMLVVLDAGPTNLRALADALDVAPSTATRMVDRLVAAGTVERTVPADNRREVHLAVTAAGRQTVADVTARRRRDIAAVLRHMAHAQRRQLPESLSAFAAAAARTWADAGAPSAP